MKLVQTIFREESSLHVGGLTLHMFGRAITVALAAGAATWLLALAIDKLSLSAVFCNGQSANTYMCVNSVLVSGYIAIVLVAIMMVPVLAVIGIKRPLVVVVAATAVLWDFGILTNGPWLASLLFNTIIFGVVYAAIVWINRLRSNPLAIGLVIGFAVVARVVLSA